MNGLQTAGSFSTFHGTESYKNSKNGSRIDFQFSTIVLMLSTYIRIKRISYNLTKKYRL